MTTTSSVEIARPIETVRTVLSDLSAVSEDTPGTRSVEFLDSPTRRVGASRPCLCEDGVELYEAVRELDEGCGYALSTTRFVKGPMQSNEIRFAVVTQSVRYQMNGGVLAPLLNQLAMGMVRRALDGALGGLKRHLESMPIGAL